MKQLLVSRDSFETRAAILEDGRLAQLYVERAGHPSLVGNIYMGRVENVLAGMDAAFVDIGLGRNGFLCVDEVVRPDIEGEQERKIANLLKTGKELLVQVIRDAMGGKGPRLTTHLGIAGRHLVYLPRTKTSGVSRRLGEEERERLRAVCEALDPGAGGFIVRTAAEGAGEEAISRDVRFLRHLWGVVEVRAATCTAPALVHAEAELAIRSVRDLVDSSFDKVVVDDAKLHRRMVNYLRAVAPELAGEVELAEGGASLFERLGLEGEAKKALARRVNLPSGGYITIDHTEAMTVIDVNTGSHVGRRYLEETVLKTNIEAGREIVRQLRLRDIGGIIVIDFIDMSDRSNRDAVLTTLQAELARDRTKTYVVEISPLGLVEMTRQNTTLGLRETLTSPCPLCHGDGRVISEETALVDVCRQLKNLASSTDTPDLRVEVHPRVAERLLSGGGPLLEQLEAETGCCVHIRAADDDRPLDYLAAIRG